MIDNPRQLEGPILITGAGGFVGANLLRNLLSVRNDVVGIAHKNSWRLEGVDPQKIVSLNLENGRALQALLDEVRPRTIFNLAAHGAYPTQTDSAKIFAISFEVARFLANWSAENRATFVQAGSSSEYGTNCTAPRETDYAEPNSSYAVAKLAVTTWSTYLSKSAGLKGGVARLYSVYGPFEEPSRLIPTLIRLAKRGELPPFSPRQVSRDFVYVDDACRAMISIANHGRQTRSFEIFNIGAGVPVRMEDVARVVREVEALNVEPKFGDSLRDWDLADWYADPRKANEVLGWISRIDFKEGYARTKQWYSQGSHERFLTERPTDSRRTKKISAIIACYKDGQAIPFMYERLKKVFVELGVDYEIIFVNDCSPDNSREVIEEISSRDSAVIGVSHSRNFGSQAAFLSGMRISTGDSCVLLDGDLQDPPELIADFVQKFEEGYDVVYGRRVNREASKFMNLAYRSFYRLMARLSQFQVPRDAGDFSLMSRRVVNQLLAMPERELFLRATRAYVGHRQVGVDYVRPERMFGRSTNNLLKNFGWATKGILTVSRAPLAALSLIGVSLFGLSVVALLAQIVVRIVRPDLSPPGVVSVLLVSTFFGSINLLAISVVGGYVGRILEESKNRPRFIAEYITRNGRSETFDAIDTDR